MNKALKALASVKITVVCLLLLFVLTFWGTVAQVQHGLYAAQERYFFSFFFLVFGIIPFPGAQLVLWVMFFNLLASGFDYFTKLQGWRYFGLKLSHFGILIYFAAAFVILHMSQEGHVHLPEGAATNVSTSYSDWELAVWKVDNKKTWEREITSFNVTKAKTGDRMTDAATGLRVTVDQFYLNANAYSDRSQKNKWLNASGITLLEPKAIDREREKNIAGGVFTFQSKNGKIFPVVLYGEEVNPTPIDVEGQMFNVLLRHTRYPLPFTIRLKEFKAEFHPGTSQAKSFESLVEIIKPGVRRDVRIYMNNPLRERDYTFYQASYATDSMGRQYSTFAVVRNAGQILPYIACFVVFIGMAFHLIVAALLKKRIG
jgi:hypothetical protein